MGMSVQPVKTQVSVPKQETLAQTALKGGIIGAGSGVAAGFSAAFSMLPKVLTKDVFSSEMIGNFRFPENTPKEVMESTIQSLKENVDELYDAYKIAADQARNAAKKNLSKSTVIAIAAATIVGAGIASAVHYFKNETSNTKIKAK